jgi:hypothetical protein
VRDEACAGPGAGDEPPALVGHPSAAWQPCLDDAHDEAGRERPEEHRPSTIDQVDVRVAHAEQAVTRSWILQHVEDHGR